MPITGYAEGFYGRLLNWPERRKIIDALQHLGLTTYYYAPKEDPCHRLHWRMPYSAHWRSEFRHFCAYAHGCGIRVVAGVAPGLDFDFVDLPHSPDFNCLVKKSRDLLADGADIVSLLMDDIDADFEKRRGSFTREGQAHAALANALGDALAADPGSAMSQLAIMTHGDELSPATVWVTPRIYADELIVEAADYLAAFVQTLHPNHCILYCGSDVVAHSLGDQSANALSTERAGSDQTEPRHHVIFWDNLYANDYCPRRLFVGPWSRRSGLRDVLLNPTGLVHTDCLLLGLMAIAMNGQKEVTSTSQGSQDGEIEQWRKMAKRHGVPDEFECLLPYFHHPHFNAANDEIPASLFSDEVAAAIEHCLWRWKTPLSREWYSFLFGLKHDLLTQSGQHPPERVLKTQNRPLAEVLIKRHRDQDQQ